MLIKELIQKLSLFDQEREILIYAGGDLFGAITVENFEGNIEIYCGWDKLRDEVD